MLTQISISNYTIVSHLEIELTGGMTVITGETGAGKSIMLDALGLCLGDRADPKAVRPGAERAEISALFDIGRLGEVQAWLRERELAAGDELLLRRVISCEGRSRAFINGAAATLPDCAELGALLVDIHSQHAHQSLLRRPAQRELLDAFAGHLALTRDVERLASEWLRRDRELQLLSGAEDERGARRQLLAYQVDELDDLALHEGELAALEEEQSLLSNAEQILATAHAALDLCEEQESGLRRALQLLGADLHTTARARDARELLDSATIQIGEAQAEIRHHIDSAQENPERLDVVRRRLEAIYDIARKHRVLPEQLAERHQALREELAGLEDGGRRAAALGAEMASLAADYEVAASTLSRQRKAAAKKLEKKVCEVLASLAMEQCRLEIALPPARSDNPHPQGREEVDILISTNPGAPPQPLARIASGGELSRISLAIQVVTARTGTVPSMVFDEVDVGIGGAVAEVVGRLLRELARNAQVLCVTHLPQVAVQGNQHLQVTKTSGGRTIQARLERLEDEDKVREIARMLGGVRITEQTLAHAREMLSG